MFSECLSYTYDMKTAPFNIMEYFFGIKQVLNTFIFGKEN